MSTRPEGFLDLDKILLTDIFEEDMVAKHLTMVDQLQLLATLGRFDIMHT